MTYYEEFGIRQDASAEEIRRAYKLLVRLLHPDGQHDSKLKALAECQMKRLGELAAILGNPNQRRKYDDSLLVAGRLQFRHVAAVEPSALSAWRSGVWGQFIVDYGLFLVLISLLVVALGLWNATSRDSDDTSLSATPRLDMTIEDPGSRPLRIARLPWAHHGPSIVAIKPRTPSRILEMPSPPALPKLSEHFSGPAQKETLLASPIPAAPKKPATPTPLEQQTFAGRWVYSPSVSEAVKPGQYVAKYVELSLAEKDGRLAGDYRAQYRIPDRAMSSEVVFQASGPIAMAGTSVTLSWTSRAGATGIAKLILQAPNVMHLAWWTTQFGPQTTLGSGTAVLIRQQAP